MRSLPAIAFTKQHVSSTNLTSWTFDFGQEFAGVVRLQLPPRTAAGTNITLMCVSFLHLVVFY